MPWIPGILSGSTDGKGIQITTTSTPGTLLHTATAISGYIDQVRLYFVNRHTDNVIVTIEWGGTGNADQIITVVPYRSGLTLELPSLRLRGGLAIRAFANVANVINVFGGIETYQ